MSDSLSPLISTPLQPLREDWGVPERVDRWAQDPRTGKIMRRLLRDVIGHGAPTGDTSAMDDPAALDAVASGADR